MDFIDAFLSGLEEDRSKSNAEFSDRIQKLFLNNEDNQGIITFAPFIDSATNQPYMSLAGVREYKACSSKFKNGEQDTWIRILPKAAYGKLTDEQAALYDKVVGLWDQVNNEIGDNDDSFYTIRMKTYSLFQGIVLSQINKKKERIDDYVGKAVLLIYPGKSPINALASAIESKIASTGTKDWIPAIFAPGKDGRDGALVINFDKKQDGGFGYASTISFEFNTTYNKIVDPSKFEQAEVDKLTDLLNPFLGWQAGEQGPFDSVVFKELADVLTVKLHTLDNPTPVPQVPNRNGVDPMVGNQPAAPAQAPAAEPTPAPVVSGVQYPF